jgi:hypothetical protein
MVMTTRTAIEIMDRLKICSIAKAKVLPHLEARVRVGRGIPHSKDSISLLMVPYSKDTCVKKNGNDDKVHIKIWERQRQEKTEFGSHAECM